jgi:hypothetical protein
MYPPYPIDSPERISLLNDLDGLRKQIDALTFPPPKSVDELGQLLGFQKESESKAGGVSITQDVVEAAKDGLWNIPALESSSASDTAISNTLDQVKALKSSLDELKVGMWKDVVDFVKQAATPESDNKATGVREQIAEFGRGIGNSVSQLVKAAESK